MPATPKQSSQGSCPADFRTTHWSVVLIAGQRELPEAGAALEKLCRAYWLSALLLRPARGCDEAEAKDLTQEFFSWLIRSGYLTWVGSASGKLRRSRSEFTNPTRR